MVASNFIHLLCFCITHCELIHLCTIMCTQITLTTLIINHPNILFFAFIVSNGLSLTCLALAIAFSLCIIVCLKLFPFLHLVLKYFIIFLHSFCWMGIPLPFCHFFPSFYFPDIIRNCRRSVSFFSFRLVHHIFCIIIITVPTSVSTEKGRLRRKWGEKKIMWKKAKSIKVLCIKISGWHTVWLVTSFWILNT